MGGYKYRVFLRKRPGLQNGVRLQGVSAYKGCPLGGVRLYFLEISLKISFGSETFREISRQISLKNLPEQRTKFADIRLHYLCTICDTLLIH